MSINLKLSEKFYSKLSETKKEKLIEIAKETLFSYWNYSNGASFVRFNEEGQKVFCYYCNNFYFEAIKTEGLGTNMTLIRDRKKNPDNNTEIFSSVRSVFDHATKTMIDKKITIHKNEQKKSHVIKHTRMRNISHKEILQTLTQGIRVEGNKPGVFLYFCNDVKVVASETQDEIRLTTAVRVSTFSEKNLIELLPQVVNGINKKIRGGLRVEVRDDNASKTLMGTDEFILLKQLEFVANHPDIPYDIKYNILNKRGRSGIYTVYQEAQFDMLDKSANLGNISYVYPEREGYVSLEDIFRMGDRSEKNLCIYFYLDNSTPERWETVLDLLKKLGYKHDNKIYKENQSNEQFIKQVESSLSGRYDERFVNNNTFDYLN